jgi:putative N6-adenine-specific DNA methylase
VAEYHPPQAPSVVICNPPWGERLDDPDLVQSWKNLRFFLKRACAGREAWLFSGNAEVTRHLGLKAEQKIPLTLGKVDARLLRYKLLPPRASE